MIAIKQVGRGFAGLVAAVAMLAPMRLHANAMPDPPVEKMPDVREGDTPVVVRKRNFAVIPIPISDPTLGTGLVVVGAYFYRQTPEQEKVQPPSVTAVAGMVTSNDSFAYGLAQQIFWAEDKWRFSGGLGHVDLDLDLLAPSPDGGGADVQWTIRGNFLQAKLFRRIVGDWYIGIQGRYFDNTQKFEADINGERFGLDVDLKTAGVGLNIEFDTRDVLANPYSGKRFELDSLFNNDSLGGDNTYRGYGARFRSYHEVAKKVVLAWEVRGCYKSGQVPLWDSCKVHLRGFPITEYLSKTSASAQAEGRWRPFKRFGFVAFLGGGLSERNYTELREDNLIPSYGIGVRGMVLEAQRINMRLDFARSDGQGAVYLAVSEAF